MNALLTALWWSSPPHIVRIRAGLCIHLTTSLEIVTGNVGSHVSEGDCVFRSTLWISTSCYQRRPILEGHFCGSEPHLCLPTSVHRRRPDIPRLHRRSSLPYIVRWSVSEEACTLNTTLWIRCSGQQRRPNPLWSSPPHTMRLKSVSLGRCLPGKPWISSLVQSGRFRLIKQETTQPNPLEIVYGNL